MDRITADWLPDDAPWAKLTKEALKTQCARRSLAVAGTKATLQQRLVEYRRTNTTEVRPRPWRLKPPAPDETDDRCFDKHPLPIIQVMDLSNSRGRFEMLFVFRPFESNASFIVYFTNKPSCACRNRRRHGRCLHIEYLLRHVFNCPEPLLWQAAFLTSELEYIYNHSHAARSRVEPDRYLQGRQCVICFCVHTTPERNVPCSACAMPMHPLCIKVFKSERRSASVEAGQCLLCVDKAAWAVEKYFGRPQVSPAVAIPVPVPVPAPASAPVPVAPASIKALAGSDRSVEGAIQPSIEAVSPDSIQRRTTLQEPQSAAQQRCTSTPLPGVPAQIWQEMQQQAREQREQQQEQNEQRQGQVQRQRQQEQKQKQQTQQQAQAQVRAVRPVITDVRVSMLPGPARVEVGSPAAAKQTPIAKKLVFEELWRSLGPAAAIGGSSKNPPPPPVLKAASKAPKAQAATPAAAGNDVSSGVHSPIQTSPTEGAATLNNNNNRDDRKAAKLARKLKRLWKRTDRLRKGVDRHMKGVEKGMRRLERVEKKIEKVEKKARRGGHWRDDMEGAEEDGSERVSSL